MTQQIAVNQPDPLARTSTKSSRTRTSTRPHRTPSPQSASVKSPPSKSISTKTVNPVITEVTVAQAAMLDETSNKQAVLVGLMHRPEGVSLLELMNVSGWQAHSVRGWISGTLRKKLGLVVSRFKSKSGETCYHIQTKPIDSDIAAVVVGAVGTVDSAGL